MPFEKKEKTGRKFEESYPAANQYQKKNNQEAMEFREIEPIYNMSDLILEASVKEELNTIIKAQENWNLVFEKWGLNTVMKQRKNVFVNLYGESGTGKTMSAHAIASALHKHICCVNYADIESKYVGETGKNLVALFEQAKRTGCILFFDEADALLSKRVTNMNNATDVSVNQTRSVLLTLLNDFEGLVIFATNFISNYDSAFMRRIQYHVKFELPNEELRILLWQYYIPDKLPTDAMPELLAKNFTGLSGSDISNAVLKAALSAAAADQKIVSYKHFNRAVKEIQESKISNNQSNVKVTKRIVDEEYVKSQLMKEN